MVSDANLELYARYRKLADDDGKVTFMGRLGDYKYYNMDVAIARSLEIGQKYF